MKRYSESEMLEANVNPQTGLATDYLNLFNEAIMLFEMGLDMPELGEELTEWAPRSYIQHFERSGFEHKDVVIGAYEAASEALRLPFDACCERAIEEFGSAIDIFLSSNLSDAGARSDLESRLRHMKARVAEMDSHIHGRVVQKTVAQSEIDALF